MFAEFINANSKSPGEASSSSSAIVNPPPTEKNSVTPDTISSLQSDTDTLWNAVNI